MTPAVDTDDLAPHERAFALEAATTPNLSVGTTDAGELVVSCHNHDDHASVAMAPVFALAEAHDLRVVDGDAHWDDETVELVIADEGWHASHDEVGEVIA